MKCSSNVHQMFIRLFHGLFMAQASDTKDDTKELTERQRVILSEIEKDCTITAQKIAQKNRATTRTIIADMLLLQQMGYLRCEGGRKNGRWVIEKRE